MIGMKDTTASGVHTLTGGSLDVLGKERSEYDVAATWDERGRRLGATWLKHTANVGVDGELPSMPFGMTTSAAESLTRVDHARPLVAERDLEMADTFARMRVDALVHGEVGTRGVDVDGRAYAALDTKKMYHSREFRSWRRGRGGCVRAERRGGATDAGWEHATGGSDGVVGAADEGRGRGGGVQRSLNRKTFGNETPGQTGSMRPILSTTGTRSSVDAVLRVSD